MTLPPYLEADMAFPAFSRVRVAAPDSAGLDLPELVSSEVRSALERVTWKPGERVAVGVGSRGITDIATLTRCVCRVLKGAGLQPTIVPAMGSHGGATDRGQEAVLAALGVTASACGADIRSTMEAVQLGTVLGEVPVHFSQDALSADHSICINRIKPHTKFKAPIESGLLKMLCVGMGKHAGALSYHRWALRHGFYPLLREMGKAVLDRSNFRFGLAVVEDALDRTLAVEAVDAERIFDREPALLETAKTHFPRLPIRDLDVLVIHQIGKEISGAGMDPNVTGRAFDLGESDFGDVLKAIRVAVLNLSKKTDGNGLGLGNADVITEKVFQDLDYGMTLMNGLTSLSLRKAFIPVRMPDDRKAIQACFATVGPVPPDRIRAAVIKDTRHVFDFLASAALAAELAELPELTIGKPKALVFDGSGNLVLPF